MRHKPPTSPRNALAGSCRSSIPHLDYCIYPFTRFKSSAFLTNQVAFNVHRQSLRNRVPNSTKKRKRHTRCLTAHTERKTSRACTSAPDSQAPSAAVEMATASLPTLTHSQRTTSTRDDHTYHNDRSCRGLRTSSSMKSHKVQRQPQDHSCLFVHDQTISLQYSTLHPTEEGNLPLSLPGNNQSDDTCTKTFASLLVRARAIKNTTAA